MSLVNCTIIKKNGDIPVPILNVLQSFMDDFLSILLDFIYLKDMLPTTPNNQCHLKLKYNYERLSKEAFLLNKRQGSGQNSGFFHAMFANTVSVSSKIMKICTSCTYTHLMHCHSYPMSWQISKHWIQGPKPQTIE